MVEKEREKERRIRSNNHFPCAADVSCQKNNMKATIGVFEDVERKHTFGVSLFPVKHCSESRREGAGATATPSLARKKGAHRESQIP